MDAKVEDAVRWLSSWPILSAALGVARNVGSFESTDDDDDKQIQGILCSEFRCSDARTLLALSIARCLRRMRSYL